METSIMFSVYGIRIKQADKFLRSSGRALDVYRNKIEAEILKLEGMLAEGFVPKVYAYDETMCVLAMEDISAYKNMRKELMEGRDKPLSPAYDFLAKYVYVFLAALVVICSFVIPGGIG